MGVWEEHGLTRYPDYFKTEWWLSLKDLHIYSDEDARCYVCKDKNTLFHIIKRKSKLLLHHVSYDNLFAEKLLKDVYIVCYICHEQAHFWTIWRFKVPLTPEWLLFSVRVRKIIKYTQKGEFGLFLIWLTLILGILVYNLVLFTVGLVFKTIWRGVSHLLFA